MADSEANGSDSPPVRSPVSCTMAGAPRMLTWTRKSAPLPQCGGMKPAGFQAIAASSSSTAMKAPPMAIGRGETVLTLPTGNAGTGSTSTRASVRARASVRGGTLLTVRLLRVTCLMKAQYIIAQGLQQAVLGTFRR